MTTVSLTLPFPPEELHPNSRAPWQAKMRAKSGSKGRYGYRDEVRLEAQRQLGRPVPLPTPVIATLEFVYQVHRKRDEDNLIAWCKSLFDGLVAAKVLAADDSGSLHIMPPVVVIDPTVKKREIRVRLESAVTEGVAVG